MGTTIPEWLQFIVRWAHLIAGISWIGNSFYFMWLDTTITRSGNKNERLEGDLWMVHGGGFYHVEKRKMRPGEMPPVLHWFKWEATFTWVTGFLLLGVLYYWGASLYLIPPSSPLTPLTSIAVSVTLLLVSWIVYDTFWESRLAHKSTPAATGVSLLFVMGLAYGLCHVFTGRGAFIHLGAIFGTCMVLNVWRRILPAQRRMIAATDRGEIPDEEEGKRAKWRSTHNSYMTLPVLFTMISNHLPVAYGDRNNWIVLLLLCVVGGFIRHMMMAWNKNKSGVQALIPALAVLALIVFITRSPVTALPSAAHVEFSAVQKIVQARCLSCHASRPTDDVFKTAPNGVSFEDPDTLRRFAAEIKLRAVVTKTMPFNNKTGITDDERGVLGAWVDQGAEIK